MSTAVGMIETASAWWECVKVAAVRELWCSVRGREESDTVGRVMDDSERHAACDRAAIEGRTVFLRSFKASFEGALGTMLVRYLVVRECMLLGFQFWLPRCVGISANSFANERDCALRQRLDCCCAEVWGSKLELGMTPKTACSRTAALRGSHASRNEAGTRCD